MAVEGIAEVICLQACTTYAQCVHDVYAACDVAAANSVCALITSRFASFAHFVYV